MKGLSKFREDADKAYSRNLVQIRIDQGYTNAFCKYYIDPFHKRKRKYEEALVKLRFTINSSLYSSGLNNVEMQHYNYNFKLNLKNGDKPAWQDTQVDPRWANAIAEEHYQIAFLNFWCDQERPGKLLSFLNLSFNDIRPKFLHSLDCLKYPDVAVTKQSKGKSRVEYYIDRLKRKFKKYGLIDNKGKLTNFGLYVAIVSTYVKYFDLEEKRKDHKNNDYRNSRFRDDDELEKKEEALSYDLNHEIMMHMDLKEEDWSHLFFEEAEIEPLKKEIMEYLMKVQY